ncbi:hypothetical protein CAI16_08175 [Virgibacillus dokdonensis]|uniref:ABC transporter ATPase n=1 Tax=Virgibacillus dokdonensis TaxID=302167 RepID=A0A3E0WR73_9BACI|nr:hypothetical protein [Virgibacillus dokdonensis]RFA35462.1 hypothetical protein CAI16_08175 [Virgibacillus dokdonensis]
MLFLIKLPEEDFAVLRKPLESGRQGLGNLGSMLFVSAFLHALIFFLTYVAAGDNTIFPYKETIFWIHLIITSHLILFSFIYAIPTVYKKSQKIQYLITILVSQNMFGILFYIMALFYIGSTFNITTISLLNFTYTTLIIGFLILLMTFVRFYILLLKGEYRERSSKDKVRAKLEAGIKSYLPILIIGSIGLLFMLQYLIRLLGLEDIYTVFMLSLCILLFYAMMFVLPEQLVILYCKYRFNSFNFNKHGELNPMGRKGA